MQVFPTALVRKTLFMISYLFIGMRQMRNHLLASEGYCVVSIDSRGSYNRGTAFEAHLRHRMGQVCISIKRHVNRCILNAHYPWLLGEFK